MELKSKKPLFILISRKQTLTIESRIRSLVHAGIDAYAIIDNGPVSGKRFITYPNSLMKETGWTNHMSYSNLPISGWDKATYYAYHSKREYVWFCEDDIYWNKASIIKSFYENNSKAELIAYPLAPSYYEFPTWYHWKKVKLLTPEKKYWMSTFNQLCRVSRSVLEKMYDLSLSKKRLFFHEGMFATICKMNEYNIKYLDQLMIPNLFINIRWNNPYKVEEIKKLIKENGLVLLHPFKDKWF
jgi:hypothetical protein